MELLLALAAAAVASKKPFLTLYNCPGSIPTLQSVHSTNSYDIYPPSFQRLNQFHFPPILHFRGKLPLQLLHSLKLRWYVGGNPGFRHIFSQIDRKLTQGAAKIRQINQRLCGFFDPT